MMCNTCGCRNAEEFDEEEEFDAEHWKQTSDASYMGDRRDLYSVRLDSGRVIRDLTEREANALCSIKEAEEFDSEFGGRGSAYAKKAKRMAYQRMGMLPKPKSVATFRRNIEYPSWFRNTQLAVVGMLSFALAYNGFKKE